MKNSHPLVSYILCVYNGESTLAATIESLLSQKRTRLELIVVNDGSSDASLSIIKKYAKIDRRIKFFNQPNLGLPKSRNIGISLATGNYIASAAQDDIYLPDKTADQIDFLKKNNLDFCFSNIEMINQTGKKIQHVNTKLYNTRLLPLPLVIFQVLFFMPLCSPTFLCKRKCYEKIKWNPSLLQFADYNLWIKMFLQFKGGKLPKVSLLHRYDAKFKNSNYRKNFPLSFLYLEHRQAATSALLYKIIPPYFILPITNFLKILNSTMILEKFPGDKMEIRRLSQIYSKLGYTYIAEKLDFLADNKQD